MEIGLAWFAVKNELTVKQIALTAIIWAVWLIVGIKVVRSVIKRSTFPWNITAAPALKSISCTAVPSTQPKNLSALVVRKHDLIW